MGDERGSDGPGEMAVTVIVREPESIHLAEGAIENGTFHGRWHFSFGDYRDPAHLQFGNLRVFNDDTLSPGAVWPLHPHREIEVVTYCAEGEFRHADERGAGGVLRKGWVQHTSVGRGMFHSEINDRADLPMRFIQMWFLPSVSGLEPSVQQKAVEKHERLNRFLPLVSNVHPGALDIASDAQVFSSFLQRRTRLRNPSRRGSGTYLYVLEGGPVQVDGKEVAAYGAAMILDQDGAEIEAERDSELLLVDVGLLMPGN